MNQTIGLPPSRVDVVVAEAKIRTRIPFGSWVRANRVYRFHHSAKYVKQFPAWSRLSVTLTRPGCTKPVLCY